MFNILKNLYYRFLGNEPELSRKEFPKDVYPAWEFIPLASGSVLARIYGLSGPLEKTFTTHDLAKKWVRTTLTKNGAESWQ